MSKKDEALKLALEALEETLRTLDDENAKPGGAISDTIWYSEHETLFDYLTTQTEAIREALAEQPAPCSHITDEQKIANGLAWLGRLEALRKECETLAKESSGTEQPAQQQEPVAWRWKMSLIPDAWQLSDQPHPEAALKEPLYTSPPASKPFVRLTDEEIQKIWRNSEHMTVNQVCRAIETKLREKNHG